MNTLVVMGFLKLSIKEEEHIDKFIRLKNMSFFWQKIRHYLSQCL